MKSYNLIFGMRAVVFTCLLFNAMAAFAEEDEMEDDAGQEVVIETQPTYSGPNAINLQKKGIFKPLQYTLGDDEPQNVFEKFSINKELEKKLNSNPEALREIKKAGTFGTIATGGMIFVTGFSIKSFLDTLDKAKRVNNGQLVDDSANFSELVPLLAAAAVTVVSSLIGKHHLKRSIALYNEGINGENAVSSLPSSSKSNSISYGLGINNTEGSNTTDGRAERPNLSAYLSYRF